MKNKFGMGQRFFLPTLVLINIALIFMVYATRDRESDVEAIRSPDKGYKVLPVTIPQAMIFAGEEVPLDNFDVREALDRELLINTYWQSHTALLLKRANRHFPTIVPILKEHGIPEDMKFIPVAESDITHATSPAGAVGFWQFLKSTAREYGLEVNDEVDERYHVVKSTEAACRFLKSARERFGSWTMAAAAYNMGRSGLLRQVDRQKTLNYYDLLLNAETGRYVYRLLALKLIMEDPEAYGFIFDQEDLYPRIPTYQVTVDGSVKDFAEFASRYHINYKILKRFNPWLRDKQLTNTKGQTYYIDIPHNGFREFAKQDD